MDTTRTPRPSRLARVVVAAATGDLGRAIAALPPADRALFDARRAWRRAALAALRDGAPYSDLPGGRP